jgi:hypothetical protein
MTVKHQQDDRHEEEMGVHVTCTSETSNLYTISIGKSEKRRKKERPGSKNEDNIKTELRKILRKCDSGLFAVLHETEANDRIFGKRE